VVTLVTQVLNGLSFGVILFLLASGFSLVFGAMGVLNLSHGALYMIGAYVGWTVTVAYGLNFWLAALAGAATAGVLGLVLERLCLRRLHGLLDQQTLLTFGVLLILTNVTQWIWGPIAKPAFTAPHLARSISVSGWTYPLARLSIIAVGLVIAAGVWWLQNGTRMGAMVRAGMENKEMAMALGIDVERVFVALFFVGSFLAGLAGVMGAQLLGADLRLGISVLLLSVVVVVVGGIGSVGGALLGGIIIGMIDVLGRAYFPQFAMFTIFVALIVILLVRPSGILGRRTDL
jgi:branched-chain amino acid transport system permease protein